MSKRKHHVTMRARVPVPLFRAVKAVADARGESMARLIERVMADHVVSQQHGLKSEAAKQ